MKAGSEPGSVRAGKQEAGGSQTVALVCRAHFLCLSFLTSLSLAGRETLAGKYFSDRGRER